MHELPEVGNYEMVGELCMNCLKWGTMEWRSELCMNCLKWGTMEWGVSYAICMDCLNSETMQNGGVSYAWTA